MTHKEALFDLLETVEAAIKAGDWKVDGACDPDSAITSAKKALAQPEQEPDLGGVDVFYPQGLDEIGTGCECPNCANGMGMCHTEESQPEQEPVVVVDTDPIDLHLYPSLRNMYAIEIAGLTSSGGHLSALVDDLRVLLGTAMEAMKSVENSASPIDESQGDSDCRIPYEQWAAFVDERAKLLFAVKHSAHDGMLTTPPQPKEPEQEPDDLTIAYMAGLSRGKDLAPQRKPWVSLTPEKIEEINCLNILWDDGERGEIVNVKEFVEAIETKLRELNEGKE